MYKIILGIIILTSLLLNSSYAIEQGDLVARERLLFLTDSVALSADFKGKLLYLDFWASWCSTCRRTLPWLAELQSKYGEQGLKVVAVNLDEEREAALSVLKDLDKRFTVLFDPKGDAADAFNVSALPSSYLIGRDGRVIETHSGFDSGDKKAIEMGISSLLQSEHAPTSTK